MKSLAILISLILSLSSFSQALEAIIIVPHVKNDIKDDLKEGSWYLNSVALAEKQSEFFKSKGVIVHKFYGDSAIWKNIVKVAPNCSFFIYIGHGGRYNPLCLTREKPLIYKDNTTKLDKEFWYDNIDTNRIKEMKLKKNSIVILSGVCFASGSSASDKSEITKEEAKKRTEHYINTFFKCGASAYFSNNYSESTYKLLVSLYEGKTISNFTDNSIIQDKYDKEEFNEIYNNNKSFKYLLYSLKYKNDPVDFYSCVCSNPNFSINTIKSK